MPPASTAVPCGGSLIAPTCSGLPSGSMSLSSTWTWTVVSSFVVAASFAVTGASLTQVTVIVTVPTAVARRR